MTENLTLLSPARLPRDRVAQCEDGFRRVCFSKTVLERHIGDLPDGDRRDHLESGGLPQ